ncbi:hypothetical protein F2Q69_00063487 [Brassica cretica]|uniref:NB-ARC domain-containing protein n=1 Tax=Brassica cretica TaxID=69181 RepID=A0A8S9RLE4_BRACR|nr:hypothetical protein F2Q69_00063487 [Brassica cretica]
MTNCRLTYDGYRQLVCIQDLLASRDIKSTMVEENEMNMSKPTSPFEPDQSHMEKHSPNGYATKGSYVHNLAENIASLEKAMGMLKAKRDDVQGRVNREEFTGHRQKLARVKVWLSSVLTIENQYNELLNTSELELGRLCLCGFCSKNMKLSCSYGKKVILMLREVESLISQGEFDVVTDAAPVAEGEELPIQSTVVGQETMLQMVWNRLMEDRVGLVGLHGMGGVGKTTLLTQINNRFSERGHGFDVVIWVVVSQNATVHKIQGSIGEKLGLGVKEWDEKSDMERAHDIHNVLRRKKFVLFLDDIWEKVNLSTIGVPYPSKVYGSKVVFTTRSRDVCGRMGVDDPIEVCCLDTDKAWDLFKKKVGEHTLGTHPDIPELAKKVAGKCRGLPLALNVIGETMASKRSVQEWRRAVDVLTSSATEFSGVDDIWRKVDLTEIGIPNPTSQNGCKIVFTTRSLGVCTSMGVHEPMEVRCLSTNDAWDLFKKKVGQNTLDIHPDIPKIARKVAGACRGLPLALNVIGETMSCKKTTQEWYHAVDVLKTYAADFSDVKEKILPILKYSYDNLEGFIDGVESKERAVNQGYEILGTLVCASLLQEGGKYDNKSYVRMHDVVREMALWIASDLEKHKESYIVRAGVGLNEVPKVQNWQLVTRMSLVNNKIKEIHESHHECPNLTTLLLQNNRCLVSISGEFFRSMPRLVVLDLSWNVELKALPEQISELVSLRYLDLSESNIVRLPVGLQKLKRLRHLNLESMLCLEGVSGISNLSSLKTLKLLNFIMWPTMSLLEELERLEHLEVLTVEITSSSVLKQLLCSHRLVRCLQKLSIKYIEEESVRVLSLPTIQDLREVFIGGCGIREIMIERNTMLTSPCLPHLSKVLIAGCNGLKDLTWLLFAPNLTHLSVWNSSQLEEIISQENAAGVEIVPFRKLEYLHLWDLPELMSIYWSPLPFPYLSLINVQNDCQKLRRLPLDSQSCVAGEELVIEYGDEEWKEKVEWADEATRLRFLPSCKLVLYDV